MMKIISFVVPGEPKAKAGPRVTRSGIAYTPKDTINYENLVRLSFQTAYPYHTPVQGKVKAEIIAYFSIPKSSSKRKRASMVLGEISPMKKPDLDNIAKIILDSLNQIAFKDDSQVTSLRVEKVYSERPCVEVRLAMEE